MLFTAVKGLALLQHWNLGLLKLFEFCDFQVWRLTLQKEKRSRKCALRINGLKLKNYQFCKNSKELYTIMILLLK